MEKMNFQYNIELKYDFGRNNCDCDGPCRCGIIDNAKIESINIESICNKISTHLFGINSTIINNYCIDRLFRIDEMYDESNWYIDIGKGYYGEEIKGVISLSINVH